jgi:hypothetical protein
MLIELISVDGFSMDPVCEHLGDLLAFPLRSHVASTVHSGEVKTALVVDEVAGDLTIGVP